MTTTGTPVSNEANRSTWRTARGSLSAFLVGALVGAGLVAAALSALGPSPLATSCTFTTVGTTMTLNGDCTTDATITIPDGYTLDGSGQTITAVDPAGGHFLGAVIRNQGASMHVEDLHVTASGLSNTCDPPTPVDTRLRGILFDGASGSVTDSQVTGINQGASGCQEGNGIEARNAPYDGTHPATKAVTFDGNTVTGYQKTGILANGDVYALITNNVVTGAGLVPYIAQNGIQLGFGATGEVRGNEISGNAYTGCSNQDAARTGCIPWVSGGLLLFDIDANAVQHSANRYRDNQRNVLVVTSASLGNP